MASKLKLIGVVLAVLAASAMTASAAYAGTFEAEEYPATLTGEQTETFEFEVEEVGTIKCNSATFSGEMSGPSSQISLAPSFKECTGLGGIPATFIANGCELVVHGGEEIEEFEFKGPMDIVCGEAAAQFEFHLGGCIFSAGAQVALGNLFIKFKWWAFPPDVIIGLKVGEVTGAIAKTPGKFCLLPQGMVTLNVYGGLTLRATGIGPYIGLGIK